MKKFIIFCSTACIPFALVWVGFVLTAFSYSPREIFQSGSFWGVSVLYWLLWMCVSPLILETINEVYDAKKKNKLSNELLKQVHEENQEILKREAKNYIPKPNAEYEAWLRENIYKKPDGLK